MVAFTDKAKVALRPVRRRIYQLLGRELPFGRQIRCDTVRLGTFYGGWTIRRDIVDRDSIVYSVGLGTDISFDLELIERFGVIVHGFDPTPKSKSWLAVQSLPVQFIYHDLGLADYDGAARFVLPPSNDVSYEITNENAAGAEAVECRVERLTTIMSDLGHDHVDLLKMDIEGAEYAVIDDLVASGIEVRQLMVEFHHEIGSRQSLGKSRKAIESLISAGYKIFDVTATGTEYAFCKS